MTPATRWQAMAELRRAILGLEPHLGADELASLRAAAEGLARPPAPVPGLRDFDPDRLDQLLALAGPETAPVLLRQLADDLDQCRTGTEAAARTGDWEGLRQASHVLISLAGSVGAMSLHGQAKALNAVAHAQDGGSLHGLLPPLLTELDALIALVGRTGLPGAAAP